MKNPLVKPPKTLPKPKDVRIHTMNTFLIPSQLGQPQMMILGLGDDDRVYSYNGASKTWSEQG